MARGEPDDLDASAGPASRLRPPLVSWKTRVAGLGRRLFEWARERRGPELEEALGQLLGPEAATAEPAQLERAFEDLLVAPGSAGDGLSVLRAFAEQAEGLEPAEREQLLRWERERRRAVYLVERCFPDHVEVWDPVAGARSSLHLPERLPPGRVASVARGSVLVATTVPWTTRTLARGQVEFWTDPRALPLFRTEVRQSGRGWHDLPPAAPTPR